MRKRHGSRSAHRIRSRDGPRRREPLQAPHGAATGPMSTAKPAPTASDTCIHHSFDNRVVHNPFSSTRSRLCNPEAKDAHRRAGCRTRSDRGSLILALRVVMGGGRLEGEKGGGRRVLATMAKAAVRWRREGDGGRNCSLCLQRQKGLLPRKRECGKYFDTCRRQRSWRDGERRAFGSPET